MVPHMWTNTASSWKRADKASTYRSDIHCHFSLERLITSCCAFVAGAAAGGGSTGFCGAPDACTAAIRKHNPTIERFIIDMLRFCFQQILFGTAAALAASRCDRPDPQRRCADLRYCPSPIAPAGTAHDQNSGRGLAFLAYSSAVPGQIVAATGRFRQT